MDLYKINIGYNNESKLMKYAIQIIGEMNDYSEINQEHRFKIKEVKKR